MSCRYLNSLPDDLHPPERPYEMEVNLIKYVARAIPVTDTSTRHKCVGSRDQ